MRLLKLLAIAVPFLLLALAVDTLAATAGKRPILDPFLILTVWHGASGRKADGMIIGALAGLLQDCLGSMVFGMRLLSKVVVGYVTMLVSAQLVPGQLATDALLVAGATVLEVIVVACAGLLLGQHFGGLSLGEIATSVVANGLVGAMGFWVVRHFSRGRDRQGAHAARGR